MTVEALQIGSVFLYYGPRRLPLGRRGVGLGCVVALDRATGVVHVRTYRESADDAPHEVEIAHLPITEACLGRSLHSTIGAQPLDPSSLESVSSWRERHARGEVGAFAVPLWEAESLAWDTASGKSPEDTLIQHAFPKPNSAGEFSLVEVACVARP